MPSVPKFLSRFGSLRSRLILLAAIGVLATSALAALLTWQAYRHERGAVVRDLRNTSHALAVLVDHDLESKQQLMRGLAASPELAQDDLAGFYHHAASIASGQHDWISLFALDGKHVLNTRLPWGSHLPDAPMPEGMVTTLLEGRTFVSDLIRSSVTDASVLIIAVPVWFGQEIHGLALVVTPEAFMAGIDLSQIAPGYVLTIVDRTGTCVARSRNADRWVGHKVTPDILEAALARRAQVAPSITLEKIAVLAAVSPAPRSGWTIALGAPAHLLTASAKRLLWMGAAATLCVLLLTGAIAWWIIQSAVRDVRQLVSDTQELGIGNTPPAHAWALAETALIGEAMRTSALRLELELEKRTQVENALRETEQRFRLATDNAMIILFEQDADLRYRWLYPLREEHRHSLGKSDLEIVPTEQGRQLTELKSTVLRTGEPQRMEISLKLPQGVRHFSIFVTAKRDARARVVGVTGVALDLTEQRDAERELGLAQRELLRTNALLEHKVRERTASMTDLVKQMEEFTYTVSHDLRAPLRAITGFSTILLEDYAPRLDDAGRALIDRIVRSGVRMDRMISDLLTLSRISRAEMPLSAVDVDGTIRDVLYDNPSLQPPHCDLRVERPLPLVLAHPTSLAQVLANLLTNAAKFVPRGRTPSIRVRGDERDDGTVRLSIRDNGIGIKPEHRSRLFRVFERVHQGDYEGNGMGLAIVRRAVERMGGRVGLESTEGEGSLFWVELPAANGQAATETSALHDSVV